MAWRREIDDTLDASMEMPEQYGSRGYWRYQQVSALIGLVTIPVLLGLNAILGDGGTSNWIITLAAFGFIAAVAFFFIRRDIRVQKRIDETGLPLVDREPY